MRGRSLRWLVPVALSLLTFAARDPRAAYPARSIRLVVPFPAGGGADFWARAVAAQLAARLGQSVVVDNRPGHGGNVGTELVAHATPDGYTLLLGSVGPLAVHPSTYATPTIDLRTALCPIAMLESSPLTLVVHPSVPARTVGDLVALAQSQPGRLTYASNGVGSPEHVAAEYFKQVTGIDIRHVPYDGAAPARAALARGEVSMMMDPMKTALPPTREGRERALAVAGTARVPGLPAVPTFGEAGLVGFEKLRIWTAVLAPAGTPRPIVDELNATIRSIVAAPAMDSAIRQQGGVPGAETPEQFSAFMTSEQAQWAALAHRTGVWRVAH